MTVPYTPQEMIVKETCAAAGVSFCMYRDFLLIWSGNYAWARKVPNMREFVGA